MVEKVRQPVFRPSVIYRDDRAALVWLEKAFGFEVSMVITDDSGAIVHAEMKYREAFVMIAREWAANTKSPSSLGGMNTQQLNIEIEGDVDAHCARARTAGARIVQEPSDQFYGDRNYRAMDPEGHVWTFSQSIAEPSMADMEKASGGLKIRDTL